MTIREFAMAPLLSCVSVTQGGYGGGTQSAILFDLIEHVIGECDPRSSCFTYQMCFVGWAIAKQHPDLLTLEVLPAEPSVSTLRLWQDRQIQRFGERRAVTSCRSLYRLRPMTALHGQAIDSAMLILAETRVS